MTKEEILELARKANCGHESMDLQWICPDNLEAFAKLIAEKEREACAKICENEYIDFDWAHVEQHAAEICAEAIRARGK